MKRGRRTSRESTNSVQISQNTPHGEEQHSPCLNRAITAWGWFFDISTNIISLMDVASDVLVAIQFYQEEEMTWFWLVLSSLILSSSVYTFFMCELPLSNERDYFKGVRCIGAFSQLPRVIKYPLVLCVAQLAPTFYWLLQQVCPRTIIVSAYEHRRLRQTWEATKQQAGGRSRAQWEEAAAIQGSTEVMGRLEMALLEHFETHLLFYIETIVESIPQSIIQLLAVTFLGQATSLQVFSMSLSLISIVSKAYTLSFAVELKMCLYKFLIAAHDVFSLFYVFATLLGKEEPDEILLFDFYFSYLSYIWIIKEFVVVSYVTVVLISIAIGAWYDKFRLARSCTRSNFFEMIGLTFFSLLAYGLLCIPVALAVEGMKLLWITVLMARVEPQRCNFPEAAMFYSFLQRGNYNERLRFLMIRWGAFMNAEGKRRHDEDTQLAKVERRPTPAPFHIDHRVQTVTEVCHTVPLKPNDLFWKVFHPLGIQGFDLKNCFDRVLCVSCTLFCIIYTVSQLFSLVFPFISFTLRYQTQNLLQRFCFYALSAPLLGLILMFPWFWSYMKFLCHTQVVWSHAGIRLEFVTSATAVYHEPPYAMIVRQNIPTRLIPFDLVNHCNKFLSPVDIDLTQLTIAECQELKNELKEYEEEEIEIGPEGAEPGHGEEEGKCSGRSSVETSRRGSFTAVSVGGEIPTAGAG